MNGAKPPEIKIILIGSVFVGKTSLIIHYQSGTFKEHLDSTSGSSYVQVKRNINGNLYNVNLWDTAGQEKYNSLTKIFSKNTNILILVYSIVDRQSFESLDRWLKLIQETNEDNDYIIGVAANKSDLYKDSVVKDSEGQEYAQRLGALWKSTSAKDGKGIEELIDSLLKQYIETHKDKINKGYIKLQGKNNSPKEGGGCCQGKKKPKESNINKVEVQSNNQMNKDEDF